jgi:hypothetical protein
MYGRVVKYMSTSKLYTRRRENLKSHTVHQYVSFKVRVCCYLVHTVSEYLKQFSAKSWGSYSEPTGYLLLLRGGIVQSVPYNCDHFLNNCASLCEFQSLLIHPPEPSDKYQQRHLVAKQEYLGEKCPLILPVKYSCYTLKGSLTCREILRHETDGFTSHPKEVMLRIYRP